MKELTHEDIVKLIQRGIDKAGSKGQLAFRLGLSNQTSHINRYMTGERKIPRSRLQKLLDFLNR